MKLSGKAESCLYSKIQGTQAGSLSVWISRLLYDNKTALNRLERPFVECAPAIGGEVPSEEIISFRLAQIRDLLESYAVEEVLKCQT